MQNSEVIGDNQNSCHCYNRGTFAGPSSFASSPTQCTLKTPNVKLI